MEDVRACRMVQNQSPAYCQVSDVLLARHHTRVPQHRIRRRRTLRPAAVPHQIFM